MKLIETLSDEQLVALLNGRSVGIFTTMILADDAFYSIVNELCLGYYTQRSGEKTISVTYDRLKSISLGNPNITKNAEQLLGELIRGKFINKWTRLYHSLVTEHYNVLSNKDSSTEKTATNQETLRHTGRNEKGGDNTHTFNYGSVVDRQGSNTDNTTFDTSVEDSGETSSKETVTRNATNDNDVFGFNSSIPVGDNVSTEVSTETTEGSADDNTIHNIQSKTGTENRTLGVNETETKSGTDSDTNEFNNTEDISNTHNNLYEIKESYVTTGRDISGAELLKSEIDLRTKYEFFNIIYTDIDSIATLQIYI